MEVPWQTFTTGVEMEIAGKTSDCMVNGMLLLTTLLETRQVAVLVKVQVITSPFEKLFPVNVLLFDPVLIPFTFH
jgi:hypothetical protein